MRTDCTGFTRVERAWFSFLVVVLFQDRIHLDFLACSSNFRLTPEVDSKVAYLSVHTHQEIEKLKIQAAAVSTKSGEQHTGPPHLTLSPLAGSCCTACLSSTL